MLRWMSTAEVGSAWMVRRISLLVITLIITMMGVSPKHTEAHNVSSKFTSAAACTLAKTTKIATIAKAVVQNKVDVRIETCYQALSDVEKALVFESMANQRGILSKLIAEAQRNRSISDFNIMGVPWQ